MEKNNNGFSANKKHYMHRFLRKYFFKHTLLNSNSYDYSIKTIVVTTKRESPEH